MIATARRKAAKTGTEVNFQVGVIEALDFANGTFDHVISSLMMHHLPAELKGPALAEIYRVLKPGGQLLIVDFDASVPRRGFAGLHHRSGPSGAIKSTGLAALVRGAGFAGVESGRLHSMPVAYVRGTRG
jgi:ubiquinone/menaquinone biosynthesis C-methylase UbiE